MEDGNYYEKPTEDSLGPLALTCCVFYLYDAWWKKNERVQKWKKRLRVKKKPHSQTQKDVVIEVQPVKGVTSKSKSPSPSPSPSPKPTTSLSPHPIPVPKPVLPTSNTPEVPDDSKAGPSMYKRK